MSRLAVLSMICLTTLSGCVNFVIREDDSAMAVAGKVTARTFGCIATIWMACGTELAIHEAKEEAEGRPYPVASGSHVPVVNEQAKQRFVVWTNNPVAMSEITSLLVLGGHQVVERARLRQVLDEQTVRLTQTAEKEADILRVGKLLGADRVIFADVLREGTQWRPCVLCGVETIYYVSISIRGVNVEDGEVKWTGSASFNRPIADPEASIGSLVRLAIDRANCPIEKGYRWVNYGTWRNKWGCLEGG